MSPLSIFLDSVLLGLSVAAPIGPINVEIIRRGLTVAGAAAFFFGLGAVTADCFYLGLSLAAADAALSIQESPALMKGGLLAGGAMLAWIAWGSIRAGMKSELSRERIEEGEGAGAKPQASYAPLRSYSLGLGLTLLNPMTIVLWLSIASGFAAHGGAASPFLRLAGVGAGAFAWVVFIVSVARFARRWVNRAFLRGVNFASGAILLYFAGKLWVEALLR